MSGDAAADHGAILLVGPGLDPRLGSRAAAELGVWAEGLDYRIVVLPRPGHRSRPDADSAERRRLARQDSAALEAALSRLHRDVPGSGRLAAFVLSTDDVSGQAGRAWFERVAEAASRIGVVLPRAVRVDAAAAIDADLLERRFADRLA